MAAIPSFSPLLPKYPSLPPPPLRSRHVSFCLTLEPPTPTSSSPSSPSDLRAVFTGGGTGGHVYPAIAIADEIKSSLPSSKILFIGSPNGMEYNAVKSAGYDYAAVPSAELTRPLISFMNLLLPFRLVKSVVDSWRVLRDFRPGIVVGTGGSVAAPVCTAAIIAGIKIVIQEQNAYPVLTSRIIAPFALKIFLSFNACVKYFPKEKISVYGNPVRPSLKEYISKAVARSHFFPRAGSKVGHEKAQVLLVLGGSTGAASINIAVLNFYYNMLLEHKDRFIIWQTGTDNYNEMESLVKNHRRLVLTPFLDRMDLAYAAADVVVCRSGAVICTEILVTGKPSILVPSTKAVDDLQTFNAYIMADIAGSKVITEEELSSSSLEVAINEILADENLMSEMSEKGLRCSRPNAAADIAQCIISLGKVSSPK